MSSADLDLNGWIRSRTQLAYPRPLSDRPVHCLQGLYPSGILWSILQIPAFVVGNTVRSYPGWLIPDLEKSNRKKLNASTELFTQIADLISFEDELSDYKYDHLSDRASDIEEQVERLERSIDRRFKVQDPVTGDDSATVFQAHGLLVLAGIALSEYCPHAPFGSILDDSETESRWWSLSAELQGEEVSGAEVEAVLGDEYHSPSFRDDPLDVRRKPRVSISSDTVYDVHSSSGLEIDIDDLVRSRKRPCVEVKTYDCGLSYLPVDATVIGVQRICRAYFEKLEAKSFEAGNTHALLCFRLHHLRSALRAYNLYDDLEGYRKELKRQIQTYSAGEGGAPTKLAPGKDMEDRKEAVEKKLRKKENWWHKGPHRGKPRWKKIAEELREEKNDLVQGPEDTFSIYPERLTQQVKEWDDIRLDEIRKELGVPPPH